MAVREQAVQTDIGLGGRRREIGEHTLHQRTPHARIRQQRARGHAGGVEDVIRSEGVVDLARQDFAEQHTDSQIERVELALGQPMQELRCSHQCGLFFVVEGVEHTQRRERAVRVGTSAAAAIAGKPLFEQLLQ